MRALPTLLQRVAADLDLHRMFVPGQTIGVAVSGGADSVCLLHVLCDLAPDRDIRLRVLHLDHQLRGDESRADAEFVGELAARLGLPFILGRATLAGGGNLEQAARRARLSFFRETIASGAVARVATGHTRSDQAETVLFRLLRGSGTAGLAAIRPVTRDGIVRPLLGVEREEITDYLRKRGIAWREDSTNASARFARNRIRRDLLPQLAREWNPEIVDTLARTADWALGEEAYWQRELDRLAPECMVINGCHVLLCTSALGELPVAAARRVVRRAMENAKGDLLGIDFAHVDEVLRMARRESGSGHLQAHGLDICRSFDQIRISPRGARSEVWDYGIPARIPGVVATPPEGRSISLELIEKSETSCLSEYVYNIGMGCVDWDRVSGSLVLRNWTPGDRYQPMGSSGVKKFKTLFQLARIPTWERCHWPVLVDGNSIVWTRRFGPAAEFAAGPETRTILRVRETEAP